jgi:serine/threonine-protein kinase
MDTARWQALSALLDDALNLAPTERAAWLQALRERDPANAEVLARMLAQAGEGEGASGPAAAGQPGEPLPPDPVAPVLDRALQQAARRAQEDEAAQADPQAADLARPGMRLGAWTLLHKIGEGGMGQVWLAERSDGLYSARSAIKLLRGDLGLGLGAGLAERFAHERALLARLSHPGIARLLDAGVQQGQAYLVLEHVAGRSLAEHVRLACPDVASRVRLLLRIAASVDYAHAQLVVHRDLKPSNVLVAEDGAPKLLDFGIAGLLGEDQVVDGALTRLTGRRLTLAYAAPEQLTGEPVGVAADVFSLGVMLFELLTGRMPFADHHSPRAVAEHALLHREAPRLTRTGEARRRTGAAPRTRGTGSKGSKGTDAAASPGTDAAADGDPLASGFSPPPPQDFERVRGDLEAVVAKALRKAPGERYVSVRSLMEDLQAWLAHRPVSVRREHWQHNLKLWLRRHALLAAAVSAVTLALSAGLAASLWQWRRAEAAARTSDQVTGYLSELLASASPDQHGGQVPTVMQLLETSRLDFEAKFANDPATRERLLQVLASTYNEMNRFDLAIPLARQRLQLAEQLHGPEDRRSLQARLDLARVYAPQGSFDQVIALLEPLQPQAVRVFGEHSDERRNLLYALSYAYTRSGRLAEADAMLAEAGRVTEAMYPPGDFNRVFHLNHVQVHAVTAGRLREGLAALKATEPYWGQVPKDSQRFGLALQRNMLAVQIRLGEYAGVAERGAQLIERIDALMGPGNDMSAGLRAELARAAHETGRYAEALSQREAVLQREEAAQVKHPALALPPRAHALFARAVAQPALPREAQLAAGRALLAQVKAQAAEVGFLRGDAYLSLARLGLVLQDAGLAAEAIGALRGDAGLKLATNQALGTRVDQLAGQLARLQGELPRSAELLALRVRYHEGLAEPVTPPSWSAQLDLALTLLRQADAAGVQRVLARARALRPAGMPAGAPLDALANWLAASAEGLATGQGPDTAAARQAWQDLGEAALRPGRPVGDLSVPAAVLI